VWAFSGGLLFAPARFVFCFWHFSVFGH
jgi:hypothetical protein